MIERIPWIIGGLGVAAFVAAWFCGPVRAAESEGRSPPTHRVVICTPSGVCEERGRTVGETACQIDAASVRLVADVPAGSRVECKRVRR